MVLVLQDEDEAIIDGSSEKEDIWTNQTIHF
jgi:hypothetical protein